MFLKKLSVLVLLISSFISSMAQKTDKYDTYWKKIDSLLEKGLPESARKETDKVFAFAKAEKKEDQLLKSLIYLSRITTQKQEESYKLNIARLEKELPGASIPVKALLSNTLAHQYLSYFNENRYKIYDRTAVEGADGKDFNTWTADQFEQKISALFRQSLQNPSALQNTPLDKFNAIILKGNVRHLRPTLYDLLVFDAIDYYKSSEREVNKPAYAFELDQASAFDPAADYVNRTFNTQDTLSKKYQALKWYQQVLAFHLKDSKPDALIDADLDRLEFVYQYSVHPEKEKLYRLALTHIASQYPALPAAAQASYLLALQASQQAEKGTDSAGFKKAISILKPILQMRDSSEGKVNAQNLYNQITRREQSFRLEKVNLPQKPFRALIQYRNTSHLFIRLIKLTEQLRKQLDNRNNEGQAEYFNKLAKLQPERSYEQPLPTTDDYRSHSVEIKIEGLESGEYLLLTSLNNDFLTEKNSLASQEFYVSSIAWFNNDNNYYVVNRETGQPLARASAQIWYPVYDYATQKTNLRQGENIMTDRNGFFKIEKSKRSNENNYRVQVSYGNDKLFIRDDIYRTYDYTGELGENSSDSSLFLFTDRSIYRPGQTVWFKGLLTEKNKSGNHRVLTGQSILLYLHDANGENIDSIQLNSNEFGTFSGQFRLPAAGLTGSFYIASDNFDERAEFNVEEYKRPKFEVTLDKPSGTYQLNETIRVTGMAKAYSGSTIDGATVKYRVTRQTIIPYWYDYLPGRKISPIFGRDRQEIAHGTVTTDATGKFQLSFPALPDNTIDKKSQPIFTYSVSVDVTDNAGETRSAESYVRVGYQSLQLIISTESKMDQDSLSSLLISSQNLNEIFQPALVNVKIYPLQSPGKVFRPRLWEEPDQFLYSQTEYQQYFPFDVYKNENLPANWPRKTAVLDRMDSTNVQNRFDLKGIKLLPGYYSVEVSTKDKNGEEIKTTKIIEVTSRQSISTENAVSLLVEKTIVQPGEKLNYQLQTTFDSLWVIHHVTKVDQQPDSNIIVLNKGSRSFSLPVEEKDRGTVSLDLVTVKNNAFYQINESVLVPFSNKMLDISFSTYRDKTLPGSSEKWKVKITGYKKDQVAAELLTAMYDISLDQFNPHSWSIPSIWNKYSSSMRFNVQGNFGIIYPFIWSLGLDQKSLEKSYDQIISDYNIVPLIGVQSKEPSRRVYAKAVMSEKIAADSDEMNGYFNLSLPAIQIVGPPDQTSKFESTEKKGGIQLRKDFRETAFFFPDLHTDSLGNIEFSFTMPEALTRWKWMLMAHTKDLRLGYAEKEIVTQKELMVQANAPRFLREGDRMDFSVKISNITEKELTGQVELQLIDPTNNQPVDGWFRNFFPNQYFTVPAGQSVPASFTIEIPFQYNRPVIYRLFARSGNISDGEEMTLPVVSNRTLVTETLPVQMKGNGTRSLSFTKLLESANSESLNHQALTVEYTSNPAWYAVQALPYLMEFPHECAEQTFNRYYANVLAQRIANASPRIKEVFERWKTADTSALLSNLNKNPELKSILLEETPWVFEANSETQQKKNIALLFDLVRLSQEMNNSVAKLASLQTSNGGFPWFSGGPDDRYITQYILSGIGHLKQLNALPNSGQLNSIIASALAYADRELVKNYEASIKNKAKGATESIGVYEIQYLYMRSMIATSAIPGNVFKAYNYYRNLAQQQWTKQPKYLQGMIALSLHRTGDIQTALQIVKSLEQNALRSDEMGMYWKEYNSNGYAWYQSGIEAQALLIEVFSEIKKEAATTDALRTWLLKNKQVQNWGTTRSTAEACYALLLQGTNWLSKEPAVSIKLGSMVVNSGTGEAGTGYFKKVIEGPKVMPSMGNIQVVVANNEPGASSWGAVYWQYFEDLDKIQSAGTSLKLVKNIYRQKNTDRGPQLELIKDGDILHVGDKVTVRLELKTDRLLEYVHLKDMRSAALEPVNVLSGYRWKGGLGYYESTRDVSSHFFFDRLPKGTWVFEYNLFVTHTGTFSNGIASLQCMYAPEFNAHSQGIKINVE